MMRTVMLAAVVGLGLATMALTGGAVAQEESPTIPASYYGTVTVGGEPAPAGTVVTAAVDGETRGQLTIETGGQLGGAAAADRKLTVRGSQADSGAAVTVFVDPPDGQRVAAEDTLTWESGAIREVSIAAPFESADADAGGGGDDDDGGGAPSGGSGGGSGGDGGDAGGGGDTTAGGGETTPSDDAASGTEPDPAPDDEQAVNTTPETSSGTDNASADTPESDGGDGGTPGFGVVAAVIALVAGGVLYRRR